MNDQVITVFYSSRAIGGYTGREGTWMVCHSCDKALGVKAKEVYSGDLIPPEVMPLVFSAELAAQELGVTFELIDIKHIPVFQRLRFKIQGRPIPCVKIGDEFINGTPTKDEIVEFHSRECPM
ncbi:MAG: hypothetical protein RTU30_06660 [Candidatus Thorarchaeota archaeon]